MNTFSVVIPVHNKEAYILKTLESVLSQSYANFEVILVNDGSSDKSGEICDQYKLKDARIRVFHQKNGGVSSARNSGIRLAKNEHIAFLDADDYWDVSFLEEMNILINTYPHNSIYGAKFARVKNGIALDEENYFPEKDNYYNFNLINNFFQKSRFPLHTSSVVIKKAVTYVVGGFDERIYVFEDYDLFLRIAIISNVGYLNKGPFSFYNIDVPVSSKVRGKLPLLAKHWISFMSKFDKDALKNTKLKILLDQMKLNQMVAYRRSGAYKKEVKNILKTVDKKNFGWKYKIIFSLPIFIGDLFLSIYSLLSNYKVKLNNQNK
ncbi:glycosyltransferase family 2 protein [Polaribacter sp. L3A8]|uniref:glycosyltransferase family 2 protein n=1 Tax=Polaribacter sp. L3A8 TaxID=2686361 RepID=UPI00131CAC3A|nr:glycosyltransferase family 2 protein [Polaribacter sp. L3A8]